MNKIKNIEYSTKELRNYNNCYIYYVKSTKNKHIIPLRDCDSAIYMAMFNFSIDYITDDINEYNRFIKTIKLLKLEYKCRAYLIGGTPDKCHGLLNITWNNINIVIDYIIARYGMADIIIGNPPYGDKTNRTLHYDITMQLLDKFKDKMVLIMPHKMCYATDTRFDEYKKAFNNVSLVEEVDSTVFDDTNMANVGIFVFESKSQDTINLKLLNGDVQKYNSWFDISPFTDYEKNIIKFLESDFCDYHWKFMGYDDTNYNNKLGVYNFSVNRENGEMNGMFFSSVLINEPIKNKIDMNNWLKTYKSTRKACIIGDDLHYLENLKNAMKNPLLRFTLHKIQDDQNISKRCFKYIPNIDWSNDIVKTDVGILELCKCPKELANEYAEYCKTYIANIDSGKNNKKGHNKIK